MGANGAGKSTLVKILTGAIRADAGRILIRGEARDVHSPAEARRAGLVSVYQEPSLIPDLDVASNLRLTRTPLEPFREWVRELGVPDLDIRDTARDIPLAVLRVLDLARALAIEPDVLLLDEMTAALPANLAERVLDVVRRQSKAGRSVIFISHRFIEISALCDRATVLRDGETVGVVDIAPGVEEQIVELMLGAADREGPRRGHAARARPACRRTVRRVSASAICASAPSSRMSRSISGMARSPASSRWKGRARTSCSARSPARSGPRAAPSRSTARPVQFGHPADAIGAGIAYVPGDRSEALLMQRSVRENIALPFSAAPPQLGTDRHAAASGPRSSAPSSGCRSTRAPSARCSGCPAATSRR